MAMSSPSRKKGLFYLLIAIVAFCSNLAISAEKDEPGDPLKLTKARALHPDMKVITYHAPATDNGQIHILYNTPPDKTLHKISIDSQTLEVIEDHPYKVPSKATTLPLDELVPMLSKKYAIKKVLSSMLTRKNELLVRTIYFVDTHNQQRSITVNAASGEVIEARKKRP